jgi:hypothetical protein
MKAKKDNTFHVRIPRETLEAKFKPGPIRILQLLMYHHTYFDTHEIGKFNKTAFASICGLSRMQLDRDLEYLRANKLIFHLHKHENKEYINPIYCFRCSNNRRLELIQGLCNGEYGKSLDPDLKPPFPVDLKFEGEELIISILRTSQIEEESAAIPNIQSNSKKKYGRLSPELLELFSAMRIDY